MSLLSAHLGLQTLTWFKSAMGYKLEEDVDQDGGDGHDGHPEREHQEDVLGEGGGARREEQLHAREAGRDRHRDEEEVGE